MIKNKTIKGAILMSVACCCFSVAGLVFKLLTWGAISANGFREIIAAAMFFVYMRLKKHKIVVNKTVLGGAFSLFLTTTLFALSNKNTSAANAIVLQFTAPVFIILFVWLVNHKRPDGMEIGACAVVFSGIILFFCDSLTTGNYLGDAFGLMSGVTYAGVFLFNTREDSDALSSVFIGDLIAGIVGMPFVCMETDFSAKTLLLLFVLGVFQQGCGYLMFTLSLDYLSAVPASLMSGLEPVLNPILVALFYPNEHLSLFAKLGALVVLVSIIGYNVAKALKENKNNAKCPQNT